MNISISYTVDAMKYGNIGRFFNHVSLRFKHGAVDLASLPPTVTQACSPNAYLR